MNIYKISQIKNNGWDTYSDAIVIAENGDEARITHPDRNIKFNYLFLKTINKDYDDMNREYGWMSSWTNPANVSVQCIGTADANMPKGVICASFHAG